MQGLLNALAPVDTGAARRQGTRNALAEMKARGTARGMNRNQAIRQTGQQAAQGGYSTEEHANALRKMGYTDAANKLVQQGQQTRSNELGNVAKGYEIIARTAPLARDQPSWDRIKGFWEEKGLAQAGELPDQFDPEIARRLAGKAREKLSASDLVEVQDPNNPNRTVFVPADMAAGMEPAREDDSTQTEREIQRYIERGYSRDVAEDIAYGNIDVETDQFGNTYLVNKATGERRVLRGQGQQGGGTEGQDQEREDPVQPQNEQEQSLFRAVDETGPWAFLRSAGNNIIGPFLEGVPFEQTAASKQQLRQFNYAVQQAFKQDDGRMSNYERQIIREFLPDPDRIFTDPDKERTKLREMRTFLERQKEQLQQSMEEKVTAQERGKLSNQIETVDRVLNLMGTPDQQQGGPGIRQPEEGGQYTRQNPSQPTTREEYEQLPSGAYFRDDEGLKRKP